MALNFVLKLIACHLFLKGYYSVVKIFTQYCTGKKNIFKKNLNIFDIAVLKYCMFVERSVFYMRKLQCSFLAFIRELWNLGSFSNCQCFT